MVSTEYKPIMGSGNRAPSGILGRTPRHGVKWQSPSEAEGILPFRSVNEVQICQFLLSDKPLKYTFQENIVAFLFRMILLFVTL